MCRPSNAALFMAALALSLSVHRAAPAEADADLDRYLESRNLVALQALHLSEQIETARPQEIADLADRLSVIYARLIEESAASEERLRWRSAATELLRMAPEDDALTRRLTIRRAEYVVAERMAEELRLGRGDAASRSECIELFRDISEDLARVGQVADRDVLRLQRQEERADAEQRALLSRHLSAARQTRSLAFYLAGWSNAYLADLQGAPARAEEAVRNFGWLLGANPGQPATVLRMPVGLLRYDHVARSAIGVAWCQATLGRASEAKEWLSAVEGAEEVAPEAAAALPLWRLVIFATLNDWVSVERALASMDTEGLATWRLVAALTFSVESPPQGSSHRVTQLRDRALAELVGMGDLASVIALGRLHGLSTLGGSGFVSACVRGLTLFERARDRDDTGEARALLDAADELAIALRSADADQYRAAAGEASLARAQALLFAARLSPVPRRRELLLESSVEFERASEYVARQSRASEAIYWAIRTLREASELGAAVDEQRRGRLVAQLLDSGADDEQAAVLLVEQLSARTSIDDVMLSRLLRIPPSSRAYDSARRLAARTLYSRYLEASPADRDWHALRYIDVAEPILFDDSQRAIDGDADAGGRAMTRGRRVLAALMGVASPDVRRAASVRRELARLIESGFSPSEEESLELIYRDAEIALAEGRTRDAEVALATLESAGSSDAERYVRSLRDFVLRRAVIDWRDARAEGAADARLLLSARRLLSVGINALTERLDDTTEEALALRVTLASAASDVWRITGDDSLKDDALQWLRVVRDAGVVDRRATRLLAELLEAGDDRTGAMDAWRDLAAAIGPPDAAWFEARYHFMRLLSEADAAEARVIIGQHEVLYPDFGPPPWGERIRALRDAIGEGAPGGDS